MPILSWKDEYSVGIAKIDDEHKQLVDMINMTHTAVDTGASKKTIAQLLLDMELYAATHFDTEEAYMRVFEYPDAKQHRAEHAGFLEHVQKADINFADDAFVPGTVKILNFLANWLVTHILRSDKRFGQFLVEKGAK